MKILISLLTIFILTFHYYILFKNTDNTFLGKNQYTKQYIELAKKEQDKLTFHYNDNNIEISFLGITKFKVLDTFFIFMGIILVFFFIMKFLNRES